MNPRQDQPPNSLPNNQGMMQWDQLQLPGYMPYQNPNNFQYQDMVYNFLPYQNLMPNYNQMYYPMGNNQYSMGSQMSQPMYQYRNDPQPMMMPQIPAYQKPVQENYYFPNYQGSQSRIEPPRIPQTPNIYSSIMQDQHVDSGPVSYPRLPISRELPLNPNLQKKTEKLSLFESNSFQVKQKLDAAQPNLNIMQRGPYNSNSINSMLPKAPPQEKPAFLPPPQMSTSLTLAKDDDNFKNDKRKQMQQNEDMTDVGGDSAANLKDLDKPNFSSNYSKDTLTFKIDLQNQSLIFQSQLDEELLDMDQINQEKYQIFLVQGRELKRKYTIGHKRKGKSKYDVLDQNILQNFGNGILMYIQSHIDFTEFIEQYYQQNDLQIGKFLTWLQDVQLVTKSHYKDNWIIYEDDNRDLKDFQQLFKILSKDFLDNWAIQFVMNTVQEQEMDSYHTAIPILLEYLTKPNILVQL